MAKVKGKIKTKGTISLKGLTTNKILEMDVYKLKTPSLKQVLNRLISTANKRLKRLKEKAPSSKALSKHLDDNNNIIKFSSKGLNNRNDIEMTLKSVKGFLQAESSTIKGFEEQKSRIEAQIGAFDSKEQEDEFYKAYNEWVDKHPNEVGRINDTNALFNTMYNEFVVKGKTSRGAKANLTKQVKAILNQEIEKHQKSALEMESNIKNGISTKPKRDF